MLLNNHYQHRTQGPRHHVCLPDVVRSLPRLGAGRHAPLLLPHTAWLQAVLYPVDSRRLAQQFPLLGPHQRVCWVHYVIMFGHLAFCGSRTNTRDCRTAILSSPKYRPPYYDGLRHRHPHFGYTGTYPHVTIPGWGWPPNFSQLYDTYFQLAALHPTTANPTTTNIRFSHLLHNQPEKR